MRITWQLPVPVQAPDQPAKAEPGLGVAVRVTIAPLLSSASQAPGQAIPAGLLVTEPLPVPERVDFQLLPGPGGAEGVEGALFGERRAQFGRDHDARAVAAGHVDLAVCRRRGFVDGDPDRAAVDDRVFELAAEEAFGVELVDGGERVLEARLGVVGDEEVAVALVDRQAGVDERDEAPGGGAGAADLPDRCGEADFRVVDLDHVVAGVGDVDLALGARECRDRDPVAVDQRAGRRSSAAGASPGSTGA